MGQCRVIFTKAGLIHQETMEDIKVEELIFGDQWISDMKSVIGSDMKLKIYISPGGKDQTIWNDEKQKDIKTITKEPADWQYLAMRNTFSRVNNEFGLTIEEVSNERQSDVQIKVSTVPNSDSVNGEWIRSWDNSGVNDIQLFMSYQSGIMLSGDPPKAPYSNPNNAVHTAEDRSVWEKIFIHEMGHLLGLEHPWDKPDGDWAVENDKVKTIDTVMGNYYLDEDGNVMDWFQEIDIKALEQIWGTVSNPNQIDIDSIVITKEIIGSIKNNKLKGKKSPTHLKGMGGNDKLIGSIKDDILDGGDGNDVLIGKTGADTYVLSSGNDKFRGFKLKEGDTIEIDSNIAYTLVQSKKNTLIQHDNGVTTVLKIQNDELAGVIDIV